MGWMPRSGRDSLAFFVPTFIAAGMLVVALEGQAPPVSPGSPVPTTAAAGDDSEVRPPVTQADLRIVERARQILDSPAKWNRADTRVCAATAKTFSLYCALERATADVTGSFEHRGAAMQEVRFVIDDVTNRKPYQHRLKDYNNDPTTTFDDVQKILKLLQERIAKRLTDEAPPRR